MSRLRVAFAGSPDFAVPSLEAAHRHCDVQCVISQPDRRSGRGQKVTPPAVKVKAQELGLAVWQPEKIREPDALARIEAMQLDLLIVVAYGQIFPQALLDLPRFGCINVHGSLLPRWRGAAPIQRSVLAGDAQTGVCIMQLEIGCDTGPVYCEKAIEIAEGQSSGDLFSALSQLGGTLLGEFLADFESRGEPKVQDPTLVTHAAKLQKSESPTDFGQSAFRVARHINGMDPWPGATAAFVDQEAKEHVLKIFGAYLQGAPEQPPGTEPGTLLAWDKERIWVACVDAPVGISEVQAPGKRRMSPQDFKGGSPIKVGDRVRNVDG